MIAANIGSGDVLLWLVEFFLFLIYFWLLVVVIGDLFRDHELSGWAKALWVLFLVVAPMLGILVYLIFRGEGMGRRQAASARRPKTASTRTSAMLREVGSHPRSRSRTRSHCWTRGAIHQGEYDRLKEKALAVDVIGDRVYVCCGGAPLHGPP